MPETIQESPEKVSPPKVGRPSKDEASGSSVKLDPAHCRQIEDWVERYYPQARPNLSDLVQEMMDLAHAVATADQQRAETPEQRRARLMGRSS